MYRSIVAMVIISAGAAAGAAWQADPEFAKGESERRQDVIYLEEDVPSYSLPDPLKLEDGRGVDSGAGWTEMRRPELVRMFEEHVYGRAPAALPAAALVAEQSDVAFDGTATRKQVTLTLSHNGKSLDLHLLLYVPNARKGPVPAFIGLNFNGNHTVHPDPAIFVTENWVRNEVSTKAENNQASADGRGANASRWPIEMILSRGYAVATIYCGDIDPDFDDGFKNGVHALFDEADPRNGEAWGTVAAWAWGLSRGLDYLESDADIDGARVSVMGHSRLGKTAVWAGARDERFALVISNNSGCGGAALSMRSYGETVGRINDSFPHWFCKNFHQYGGNEGALPVDQHQLVALVAPRPFYAASADRDLWADPRGEFLSVLHAQPVYELLGVPHLTRETMPPLDTPVMEGRIGYHVRSGKHAVTAYDWGRYLDFADGHLK